MPAGVLNIVTASREKTPEVVDVWLDDARVRKITFTGSTATGRSVMAGGAPTIKRTFLELGGKSAAVVLDAPSVEAEMAGAGVPRFGSPERAVNSLATGGRA